MLRIINPKSRDKGSQGMANNILRCWRCKGEGKINPITTCPVCQGKGTIFTNALDSPEKYDYGRQKRAEVKEVLWDLVKKKSVTNDKILQYIKWYSEIHLDRYIFDELKSAPYREPPPITKRQHKIANSLLSMAWERIRNRERARSPSARWRRGITSKRIVLKKKRCELCGKRRKLVLHHLIPIYMGGEHVEENLIAVCKECHHPRGPLHSYKILKAVRRYKGKHKRIEILRGILARWRQGKKIIVRGGNLYQRYAARISEETTKAG